MMYDNTRAVIDFNSYIARNTHSFTGREWVFQAINDWLAKPSGSRYFLLTGEPGSGKTTIASRLSQFSQGTVTLPEDFIYLTPSFISAIHFCSAQDNRWIDPYIFIESLAIQLAKRYPVYAKALAEKSGDRQIHIEVQQHVEQGQVTGLVINRLDVSRGVPEDAFNHAIREPLEALFHSGFDQQIIILVDALDEALSYSGNMSIVSLLAHINELSPRVHFILTSRPDLRVENAFLNADTLTLSATQFDQSNQEDIDRYVNDRLGKDSQLIEKVTQLDSEQVVEQVINTIVRKAEGNFLYVHFLLNAIANNERSLTELEGLPEGLDGLYFESLQRVVRLGKDDWHKEYVPIIGMLSVAQENLTLAQLQSFTMQSKSSVLKYLDDLRQFIEEVKSPNQKETQYRLYHQSVIDFLHRQSLILKNRDLRNTFYLPKDEWHKVLAAWCVRDNLTTVWEDTDLDPLEQARREYTRAYYITHLYAAHEWQSLFAVLDEGAYGRTKVQYYDTSARSYAQDLDLGRQAAASSGKDGLNLLPYLWRYTLLRCSLNSTADQYIPEAFEALLLLKKEKEARDIAELLTKPDNKAKVLLQIANYLETQPGREQEHLMLLNRIYEIMRFLEENEENANVLQGLCVALARKRQWAQAEAVISLVKNQEKRIWMLQRLAQALAQAQKWDKAETTAHTIDECGARADVLQIIGALLAEAQLQEQAEAMWYKAEALIHLIQDVEEKAWALQGLCATLTQARQWDRAKVMAQAIEVKRRRLWALQNLSEELAREGKWESAEDLAHGIEYTRERAKTLFVLGIELARSKCQERAETMWTEAETLVGTIEDNRAKVWALLELGRILTQAGYLERAEAIWTEAKTVAHAIEEDRSKTSALQEIGKALVEAQQLEDAALVLSEVEALTCTGSRRNTGRLASLHDLSTLLAQARQWDQAEAVARTIEDSNEREWTLQELCEVFAHDRQWERAEALAHTIEDGRWKARALLILCAELARSQQWEHANAIWNKVPTINHFLREEREAKSYALQELGLALAKTEQSPQAEAVLNEAEAVIRMIEEENGRASALLDLSATLSQAGYWERAEVVAREIKHEIFRAWALQGLCMMLTQSQQWERAIVFARQIEDSSTKAKALQGLGVALAHARCWEKAEIVLAEADEVVHTVESSNTARAGALYSLGCTLIQTGEQARGEAALAEAEMVARTIEEIQAKAGVLQMISIALAGAQLWGRAKAVASTIEDRNSRANALQQIGIKLVQAQRWEDANAVVDMIEESKAKVWILQEFSTALAQEGHLERVEAKWAEIEKVAQTIDEYEGKAFAMQRLGIALAQAGYMERAEAKWAKAEASVFMIKDSNARDWTLRGLCLLLVQAQQWKRAKVVTDMIEHNDEKARALVGLATALAEAQQWDDTKEVLVEVEMLVHTMQDYQSKIGILHNMVSIFEKAGKPEEVIHLIQRSLLQASTKIYAIRLLSLIARLIPYKPKIGTAFCEAFTWVDSFSKG